MRAIQRELRDRWKPICSDVSGSTDVTSRKQKHMAITRRRWAFQLASQSADVSSTVSHAESVGSMKAYGEISALNLASHIDVSPNPSKIFGINICRRLELILVYTQMLLLCFPKSYVILLLGKDKLLENYSLLFLDFSPNFQLKFMKSIFLKNL